MADNKKKQNTISKANIFGIIIFLVIVVGISSFGSLISFVSDYKWFSEVGYTGTFLTKLRTQFIIGVPLFIVLMLVFNYYLTYLKKKYFKEMSLSLDKDNLKKVNLAIRLGSVVLAFFFTVSVVSSMWFEILEFMKGQLFNVTDPIFNQDIGFYVFKLPFINSILNFLMAMLFIFIVITVAFNMIIFTAKTTTRMRSGEKVIDFEELSHKRKPFNDTIDKKTITNILNQVAFFGAAFLLILGIRSWLRSYDLLYSTRGNVYGASYTDIVVSLKLYRITAVAAIAGAVTFFLGSRRKNLILALAMPAALIVITIAGGIVGGAVEQFVVEPDQISKEMQYIEYNIEYTQKAYGLEDVNEVEYPVKYDLSKTDINFNKDIINNIRINDYRPIEQVYNQIQGIRPYYVYNDVDIDRYTIDGEYKQVFLSARELDQSKLDSQAQTWINQVLKYTHGYGFSLSPVNDVTSEGQPILLVKDIPPTTTTDLNITRPEIYFGEMTNDYVIVNTDEEEFDYPSGSDNVMTFYDGTAGIELSGMNKLLFTIRQGSLKIFISNNINSDSRIILHRNILTRVKKIAPFLTFGSDPYLVVNQDDGKLYWIIEAFSLSEKYPYSQPIADYSYNYIRNPIKVVIDAYNGDTDFYITDDTDALAATYREIFPDLFKNLDEMPQGIREHIRYAQEYFDVQSEIYRTYHMENPTVFFGREDLWEISEEKYMDVVQTVESNYVMFKLPEEDDVEFLLSVPYSPVGKNNMTALFAARNDGENYGELVLYRYSKNENIPGTNMIESRIDQDSYISPQLTLWSQEGSNVLRGSILVIPIEESLLYIEPIYLQADNENSLPEMKKVIAAYADNIVMEDTLEEALNTLFGSDYDSGEGEIGEKTTTDLIIEANELYEKADEALKNGEWARYGIYIEQLKKVLTQLEINEGIEIEDEVEEPQEEPTTDEEPAEQPVTPLTTQ